MGKAMDSIGQALKAVKGADKAAIQAAKTAKYASWMKGAGSVLTVGLLGYEFYINLKNWNEGKIDGVACTRNISGTVVGMTASYAAGAALGSVAGPAGMLVGGIVGGLIASELTYGVFNLVK